MGRGLLLLSCLAWGLGYVDSQPVLLNYLMHDVIFKQVLSVIHDNLGISIV